MKNWLVNTILVFVSLAATAGLIVAADRIIGATKARKPFTAGLMFTPNADAHYKTIEFEFTVHTNNLGIRGPDVPQQKTHKTRVIAIGDSFTYGWGVEYEDTWAHRLEATLRTGGQDVEVLNVGMPGSWPGNYADTAADAIPLLKPDVVVIGLLQGDDLRQCDGATPVVDKPKSGSGRTLLQFVRETLLPNISGVAIRQREEMAKRLGDSSKGRWDFVNNVKSTWVQQARGYMKLMNAKEKAELQRMPDPLPRAFTEGEISPTLLGILFPGAWQREMRKAQEKAAAANGQPAPAQEPPVDEFDIRSPGMQRRIAACANYLVRIRAVAEKNGARVVVLSIPAQGYVCESGWQKLPPGTAPESVKPPRPEDFITTAPDDANRAACDRAGVPMIEVTADFRAKAGTVPRFYAYDTHFTAAGNELFSELVAPKLRQFLP